MYSENSKIVIYLDSFLIKMIIFGYLFYLYQFLRRLPCSLLAVLVSEYRRCFTLCLFIILLVQFGLLSGHLLGNSCPLG